MLVVHRIVTKDNIVSHSLVLGFILSRFMPWEDLYEVFKIMVIFATQGTSLKFNL